jgi:hypothetical protein
VCGCCGVIFCRKRPVKEDLIIRQVTFVERKSTVEGKEGSVINVNKN